MKRVGDLLAIGLFLIGIWILTSLTSFLETIGLWSGIVGSIFLIISEGYYLKEAWFK